MDQSTKLFTKIIKPTYTNLYEWSSLERIWSPKPREWFLAYSALFVFFIALAALLGQYLLVLTIISFSFLWFIQAAVEPQIARHKITNLGIKTYGKFIRWSEVKHFWFGFKDNTYLLNLETISDFDNPGRVNRRYALLLNSENNMNEVFDILSQYCDYGDKSEIEFNFITQFANGSHIPMDNFIDDNHKTEKIKVFDDDDDLIG